MFAVATHAHAHNTPHSSYTAVYLLMKTITDCLWYMSASVGVQSIVYERSFFKWGMHKMQYFEIDVSLYILRWTFYITWNLFYKWIPAATPFTGFIWKFYLPNFQKIYRLSVILMWINNTPNQTEQNARMHASFVYLMFEVFRIII